MCSNKLRRTLRKYRLTLAVGLATWMSASAASAFTVNSTAADVQGWDTKTLQFHLNPTNCPDTVAETLKAAITLWNSVPTAGLTLKRGADTTQTLAQIQSGAGTDVPAIFCSTTFSADGGGVDANDIPGFATGARYDANGHINYGYLLLNAQPGAAANVGTLSPLVVKVVVSHEMGHVMGLGHSQSTDALMYYDASYKQNLALAEDDMDGLTYLYPRNELGSDPLMGCATVRGVTSTAGAGSRAGLVALLCMPLALAAVSRRRVLAKVRVRARSTPTTDDRRVEKACDRRGAKDESLDIGLG